MVLCAQLICMQLFPSQHLEHCFARQPASCVLQGKPTVVTLYP